MRVLFVIHEFARNGAVIALLQQVRHMRARGDAVTILTPPLNGPAAALEQAFRRTEVTITTEITTIGDFDAAVGCTVSAAESMAQLAGVLPTVWWIHEGRAGVNMVTKHPKAMQTLGRVGRLVFPSRGVVDRVWQPYLHNLPPGRVEIIPNGIPQPEPGPGVPRPDGRPRIICVGRVCPPKRQADLAQAVCAFSDLPLQCVLVGQPFSMSEPAKALIQEHADRFVLTGDLDPDHVQGWYRSSDVFCLPSGDECMPISPVEAAWHGLPVILADLECYEGVWRHGVNALIHPVGDVEMLAWYIRMLVRSPNLRARLNAEGRNVARRFSVQRATALFDAVIQEAIDSFRSGPTG